jgi:hypothetical protein
MYYISEHTVDVCFVFSFDVIIYFAINRNVNIVLRKMLSLSEPFISHSSAREVLRS